MPLICLPKHLCWEKIVCFVSYELLTLWTPAAVSGHCLLLSHFTHFGLIFYCNIQVLHLCGNSTIMAWSRWNWKMSCVVGFQGTLLLNCCDVTNMASQSHWGTQNFIYFTDSCWYILAKCLNKTYRINCMLMRHDYFWQAFLSFQLLAVWCLSFDKVFNYQWRKMHNVSNLSADSVCSATFKYVVRYDDYNTRASLFLRK